jgi:hypothetical protein
VIGMNDVIVVIGLIAIKDTFQCRELKDNCFLNARMAFFKINPITQLQ